MFKRILIPTDRSKVGRKAIKAGVAFAKDQGASVVGYYAAEGIERIYYAEGANIRPAAVKAIEQRIVARGQEHLAEIQKAAEAAGVPCEVVLGRPGSPHQGIIDTALKKKCDIVFMSSHGRGEIASLLLGSVTQKVLAHSTIPELVYR